MCVLVCEKQHTQGEVEVVACPLHLPLTLPLPLVLLSPCQVEDAASSEMPLDMALYVSQDVD